MKRLRLETTTATAMAAKHRAALLDRYGATSMVRAPTPASSMLERLNAVPPRSERAAELGLQWLAQTYPLVFGANFIPIAPELAHIVNDAAREAGLSRWVREIIKGRVRSRNRHHDTRQAIAAPGSYWHSLHGRPLRPITDAERRALRS